MSVIFDLLYREYCRARLAEMRKQLQVSVASYEIPETNWDASDPAGPGDRDSGLGDGTATKEAPNHPVAGPRNHIGSVGDPLGTRTLRSIVSNLKYEGVPEECLIDLRPTQKACSHAGQGNQMLDRIHTSKPLVGEPPPEFKGSGRDLRIDAFRGVALWCIFLDHVPNNIGSWLTLRNYGFSDAAEVFMFVSGVTCALAYGRARRCEGWSGVISRSLRRGWDIYAAFLLLTLACAIMVHLAGSDHLADESNTRILLEHPGATLAHAVILQYSPVNADVLLIFVLFHLLFAPLLWLLLRWPNATLGASFALFVLVHVFGWTVPAWPSSHWAFNPLAWQFLVVLGAWWMIAGKRVQSWTTSRTALVVAVLYVLFSLVIALSWHIKPLEALIPQALAKLFHPLDKSNLDPVRLLHFLAIAVLAQRLVPRDWQALKTPMLRGAIRCGQNSLPIYCLGVLLACGSHAALLEISNGVAMQIALSVGGIVVMIVAAMLLNSMTIKPGRQPLWTQPIEPVTAPTQTGRIAGRIIS